MECRDHLQPQQRPVAALLMLLLEGGLEADQSDAAIAGSSVVCC